MDLTEEIRRLAEPLLAPGHFIVEVIVTAKKGPGKVLVLVDGDEGISIDDCAEISRKLSKALDDAALLNDKYLLEVSTPGVDHSLKLKRQYTKHIGRTLKLKMGERGVDGKLSEIKDDILVLTQEVGTGKKKETVTVEVPFAEIEKAFVVVSFK
jgi:ribosome maturation factor RimP